ncbi:hypothetical protein BSIN_2734 [Burkholderia singularis]|uniref:Uncharacterized protein n=1 Tax=Burkholderia singularis TaxID=1503053 RepID=A0A238H0V6_9BURK|nr:hypothetical protein BSIN_2734 [Burkholderia singularis]
MFVTVMKYMTFANAGRCPMIASGSMAQLIAERFVASTARRE